MTILALAAGAALMAAAVAAPHVEHLGQPCRAKNILSGRAVTDPAGKRWLVLADTNEDSGCHLLFIDYENNTGRAIRAPAGSGAWALDEVSGKRLVVGTFYDGTYMVFDLNKMEFIQSVKFPGEGYIWNSAMGGDGRIYGGTYGGGKLGALDLATYELEDCGAPAKPNRYLRNVSPMPDGRIFCYFGMEEPVRMVYDPESKTFTRAPEHLQNATQGVLWGGYFIAERTVCKPGSLEQVQWPFPLPPDPGKPWSVDAQVTTPETLVIRQGDSLFRFAQGDKELTLITDTNLRGRALALTEDGRLLGVRGQDYFVCKPGDKDIRLQPIPAETGPRPTMFLEVDDRGRVWGGPHFGQTLFWMDPATKKTVNTSTVCDGGGEVYDVAFSGGKTFAAAYAGGDIVRYDPEQPWDQWNNVNPKLIASVGKDGFIRPVAGILLGPDNLLYSGWMARYGEYGGAVAITQPESGETRVIKNPLGEQAIAGIETDGRFIYIGTSLGANGLPNKKNESPKFGVLDAKTGEVVFKTDIEGTGSVWRFALDSVTRRLAFNVNKELRVFDTTSSQFLPDLVGGAPPVTGKSLKAPGDGSAYYTSGQSVVRFDMKTGAHAVLAELPKDIECLAVGPDGAIYVSCGVDLYAVRR